MAGTRRWRFSASKASPKPRRGGKADRRTKRTEEKEDPAVDTTVRRPGSVRHAHPPARRWNGQRPLGQDQRRHPTTPPLILASDLAHSTCSTPRLISSDRHRYEPYWCAVE